MRHYLVWMALGLLRWSSPRARAGPSAGPGSRSDRPDLRLSPRTRAASPFDADAGSRPCPPERPWGSWGRARRPIPYFRFDRCHGLREEKLFKRCLPGQPSMDDRRPPDMTTAPTCSPTFRYELGPPLTGRSSFHGSASIPPLPRPTRVSRYAGADCYNRDHMSLANRLRVVEAFLRRKTRTGYHGVRLSAGCNLRCVMHPVHEVRRPTGFMVGRIRDCSGKIAPALRSSPGGNGGFADELPYDRLCRGCPPPRHPGGPRDQRHASTLEKARPRWPMTCPTSFPLDGVTRRPTTPSA